MEVLAAHGYGDAVLHLANPDSLEVLWTIKKVSLAPSLGHNFLNTIPIANKGVEVLLRLIQIPSEISHYGELFRVRHIINNQYVVHIKGYFPNSTLDQKVIN